MNLQWKQARWVMMDTDRTYNLFASESWLQPQTELVDKL